MRARGCRHARRCICAICDICGSSVGSNVRIGQPKEIAEVAPSRAGEASSLVNGAVVTADAGGAAY